MHAKCMQCDADVFVELASRSGVRPSGAMASAEVLVSTVIQEGSQHSAAIKGQWQTVRHSRQCWQAAGWLQRTQAASWKQSLSLTNPSSNPHSYVCDCLGNGLRR